GNDLVPNAVTLSTAVASVKMLSPSAPSPSAPLSSRNTEAPPPIDVRSQLTARLADAGPVPGVTIALSVTLPPRTALGGADDEPVMLMSSMPIHSSLPTASVVMMRTWTTGWLFALAGSVADTGV